MKDNNCFYQVFAASPIPTTILSGTFPNLYIKEANPAYIRLTGKSREDIVGTLFFTATPHPGMYLDNSGFADLQRSIEKVYLEKSVIKTPIQKFVKPTGEKGGFETLYLEATNNPVFSADGEIEFVVRTVQNVTDIVISLENEKAKETQLAENERFLRETQKLARIASWEIDKKNRIYLSDIHYEMMEEEPGKEITVEYVLPLFKTEGDRQLFENVRKKAFESGEYFDVELNIVTQKGNERWIRLVGAGEVREDGFARMYGIGQDISEQKKTRQALIDSRNQLETLIQTVEGVVFESNAQTLDFTFVSEQIEDLLGYTPEECINQPEFLNLLLHRNGKEEILKVTFDKIQTNKNYTGDYQVVRKDGVLVWIKVSVSVIYEDGAPKWLRGLMMDINASKQMGELERVEKKVLELNAKPSEPTQSILKNYLQGIEAVFPEMRCAIMKAHRGRLFNWASNSLPPAYEAAIDNIPISNNSGSCGTAAFKKEKVIVSDIATDPRWADYKEIALQHHLRSCWSQPITNAEGEVMATVGMYYSTVKTPTTDELKVIDRMVYLLQVILQGRNNLELLEEANFLMKQSQELAHFGSVQLDVATRELTWSGELFNIFGLDRSVKPTIDLYYAALHPEDRNGVLANIENFLQTKKDYVSEERIIRPDGEVRYLRTWGRVKTNEKGETVKVIASYIDITESKKIQEDLLASETRLRSLVDSQTNYVIRIDFNQNYSYANRKYMEDFGLITGENIIGTDAMVTVLPAQQERVKEVSRKCIAHPNEVFEVELEKYSNEGSVKYTFWHFICLTDSKGEPTEIQCIGIDVTDRKKAEMEKEKKAIELEDSERRYSHLFHLSPQPMWVYDSSSLQFLDVNIAAIQQYGYSRDEFLSMTISDIRPVEHLSYLHATVENRNKQEGFFRGIFTHRKKNGEHIQVDIQRNKIPFKGRIAHLVLANNITERIQYLDALEKQNERLGEIAWIQSHIVRAPLARIMGLVDVLENFNDDDLDQSLLLNNIVSSAHELDKIVKDIVLKAEQVKLSSKPYNP